MGDVPLNEEGLQQAQSLATDSRWQSVSRILSSPKKRALMTVQPLAEKRNLNVQVFSELDQMRGAESEADFNTRVRNFLYRVEQQEFGGNLMICSHSDWLAAAAHMIPTDSMDLKHKMFHCAEVLSFSIEEGLWKHL